MPFSTVSSAPLPEGGFRVALVLPFPDVQKFGISLIVCAVDHIGNVGHFHHPCTADGPI